MKKRSASKLYYLLIISILVIAGFLINTFVLSEPEHSEIITAIVQTGDIEQTVLADGTIKAFKQVSVGAQATGQIKALHVALGDRIVKGQPIAEIDDLTQQNDLRDAKATIKNINAQRTAKMANLRNYKAKFERQQKLLRTNSGTEADYDEALSNLESTQADIEALDAQLDKAQIAVEKAKLDLRYTKINSPMDGIVVAIPVEEGQTVNAVQSAPTIIKVAQLDTMTIEAQISEADVPKIKPGMPVFFTILGEPDTRYSATLRTIEPAPSSINNESPASSGNTSNTAIYYNGLFDVPNPENKLRISMTAQVYIILEQAKDAVLIPVTALSNMGNTDKDSVNVVDEQRNITEREVIVGINNNINAEILSGLQAGETIISSQSKEFSSSTGTKRRVSIRM